MAFGDTIEVEGVVFTHSGGSSFVAHSSEDKFHARPVSVMADAGVLKLRCGDGETAGNWEEAARKLGTFFASSSSEIEGNNRLMEDFERQVSATSDGS